MALTPQQSAQLVSLLGQPAYAGLTDAAAYTLATTPVLTPRTEWLTLTTLGASDCWGAAATIAFDAAIQTAIASTSTTPIPGITPAVTFPQLAAYVFHLLGGPGINPQDPQLSALLALFVANGVISQAQATAVQGVSKSPLPFTFAVADITAARAVMSAKAQAQKLRNQVRAAGALIPNDSQILAGSAVPAASALTAQITG